jgi:hypothetical protein
MIFYIIETNEVRPKRVSSLKTYRLQVELVMGKLGESCKTFPKNIETRPVVL